MSYELGKWQYEAIRQAQAGHDALVAKCNADVLESNRKLGVLVAQARVENGVPDEYLVDVRTGEWVEPPTPAGRVPVMPPMAGMPPPAAPEQQQ